MRIETTAEEIRAPLQLAQFDVDAPELPLEAYRARRDTIRKRVARALLERYQALFDGGRVPPIVAIERGACSGCHLRLPTMMESRSRRLPGVYACPQCRRMLYAPVLLAAEDPDVKSPHKKVASPRASRISPPERS